jgi:phthiodiolone/phenolphthiodiolone dimycocerosates ketoreductase
MMRATRRYADGWFPGTTRASEYGEQLQIVRAAASDAGRDPTAITPALIRFIVTASVRKSATATAPYVKVVRALKKL